MKIDPNTKCFKLVKYQASYRVHMVAENGNSLPLIANNGQPVLVRSVKALRDRLGRLASAGRIEEQFFNVPIVIEKQS